MQKEIKFRAWDKEKKEWIIRMNTDINYDDLTFGFFEQENLEIMQFTGIYNVEGKEIYENDIVEEEYFSEKNDGSKEIRKGKIVWLKALSKFILETEKDNDPLFNLDD